MWKCEVKLNESSQLNNLVSSMQIGDEPITYGNGSEIRMSGAEPAVFMVALEQDGNNEGNPPRLSETTEELRSSYRIGDRPVIYGQSTHLGTANLSSAGAAALALPPSPPAAMVVFQSKPIPPMSWWD